MSFKSITRIGDLETSHDGCPESRLVEGDHRITIFGQPVGRIGDHYEAHSSSQEDEHRDYIKEGINAVTAWGIPVATVGCLVSTDGHGEDTHVLTGENRCSVSTNWSKENGYENGFMANRDRIKAFSPNETDKTILCLPDICDAEATRSENADTAQGWLYLRDMFVKWFSGYAQTDALSNPDAFFVDIEWAMRSATIANAVQEVRETILSENAKKAIYSRLKTCNLIGNDASVPFDFMLVGQNSFWKYRIENQTQKASVKVSSEAKYRDWPVFIALRGCSVYGLVRGTINLLDDGRHQVTVSSAGAIIYDKFTFDNESVIFRYLGSWNCRNKKFSYTIIGTDLFDEDFIKFRSEYNCGNDFVVTSDVYVFDDFKEYSFIYE